MKIYRCDAFGPPESLQRVDVEAPTPRADEVLVDVAAAGVGFVDGLMIQGKYQVKPPLPYFPGSEFAGTVRALGRDVQGLIVGARVLGTAAGAYADQVVTRAAALYEMPEALDFSTAAGFFINYATALYGLRDCGHLAAGETVLVLGAAGGVGSAAIAVAKAFGARVIAGASSEAKRTAAISFGADAAVDYTAPDWRSALKELTGGQLDMVYDPVGGALSEAAFRNLSPGGRFLVVGFAAGDIAKIPLNLPLLKRASIVGVDWGGEMRANPAINRELMGTLFEMIAAGRLQPAGVVEKPMDALPAALTQQLAGDIVGKLVMVNRPGV